MKKYLKLCCSLALVCLLSACKVALYSELSENEANQMLAILMANQIDASKETEKAKGLTLHVPKSQFIKAVEVLRQNGYPKPKYASVMDVFPANQLVSSPEQERAKMEYLKEQQIEAMLMSMDGVVSANVNIGTPLTDTLGSESAKSTVSVFIKYSPAMNLIAYQEQIRDLVRQGIPGIPSNNISVVMVPAVYRYVQAQTQPSPLPNKWWALLVQSPILFGTTIALLLALIGSAIGFSIWQTRRNS